MCKPDVLAERASAIFFERAERRLEALLAEHGVSNPDELPRSLQWQLLQQASIEAAAANFPQANLLMMRHQLSSFGHSAFRGAMDRMIVSSKFPRDAFEMATGIHAAVVLAGYGLPVAPFDLKASRIVAKPSNEIDTVLKLFSRNKGACVGYSSCDAPFYLLLTDCIRTLRRLVPVDPRLAAVKELFARTNKSLPPDPGRSFVHGSVIIARQPGDTISTVALLNPDPTGGSVMLYAGWHVKGEPCGAPNEGYIPVPTQLLTAVVNDPAVAFSFWAIDGAPKVIN